MASAPNAPVSTPKPVPMKKATRLPQAREIQPVGSVPAASPSTYIESGTVASEMFGASVAPTIEPVAKITAELAPVSACAAASRSTLPRARASSVTSRVAVVSSIGIPARRAPGREPHRFIAGHYEDARGRDQPAQTGVRYASGASTCRRKCFFGPKDGPAQCTGSFARAWAADYTSPIHLTKTPFHGRFLPDLFSARTAPVLWTFERGSTRPARGKCGLQSSAIVAAKPKKLERLMPSSVARLSIRAIRLFGK